MIHPSLSLRRRHFARHEIIQPILVAATGGVEEPIAAGLAVKLIEGGILRQESIGLFQEYVARHQSGALVDWAQRLTEL